MTDICDSAPGPDAAHILRDAMQGIGTDKTQIISLLAGLNNEEVVPLCTSYNSTFSRDLHHDIKSESKIHGHFKNACIACLTQVDEYDAKVLRDAVDGLGTDESQLIEVICNRSDEELKRIAHAYNRMYTQELKARVKLETSGKLEDLLCTVLSGRASTVADDIDQLVAILYRAGEGKLGTNEGAFIRILGGHSPGVVQQIHEAYLEAHGKTLQRVIKSEFGGKLEDALLALATPTDIWYAKAFKKCVTGIGTDEAGVIRIIRSRKEKDLPAISQHLEGTPEHRGKPMTQWIVEDLSGDTRRLLVALCTNFAGRASQ